MSLDEFKEHWGRHGALRTVRHYGFRALRRVVDFEVLVVQATADAGRKRLTGLDEYVTRVVGGDEYATGTQALPGDHQRSEAFAGGDTCYSNFVDGRLVGYSFYSSRPTPHRDGLLFQFPERFMYLYAGYTAPEHRGRGLAAARANKRREIDEAAGIERDIVWHIAVDNDASRASARQWQTKHIGYLAYIKLRGHFYCYASSGCRRLGVRLKPTSEGFEGQ